MPSPIDICNLALARISQDKIMSLAEESPNGRACNAFYAQTRDEILESHRWKFAIKEAELSALTSTPLTNWDYEYELPTDCIRCVILNGCFYGEPETYWEQQGRSLLTNDPAAIISYIWRVTDSTFFTPLFTEALSVKLAARICKPLTGSDQAAAAFLTEYERITGPQARRLDAYLGRTHPVIPYRDSDLVNSRFGGYGYGFWWRNR